MMIVIIGMTMNMDTVIGSLISSVTWQLLPSRMLTFTIV